MTISVPPFTCHVRRSAEKMCVTMPAPSLEILPGRNHAHSLSLLPSSCDLSVAFLTLPYSARAAAALSSSNSPAPPLINPPHSPTCPLFSSCSHNFAPTHSCLISSQKQSLHQHRCSIYPSNQLPNTHLSQWAETTRFLSIQTLRTANMLTSPSPHAVSRPLTFCLD